MPIVVRRGQACAEPRSRQVRFERPTSAIVTSAVVDREPPGPDPRHELARLALDLVVRTVEPAEIPARWKTYPFGQEVDRTRVQLAPIRSRAALLASFSREASIAATRGVVDSGLPAGPVRVAYAIRWLELGDGQARRTWASFVAWPVEIVVGALAGTGCTSDDQRNGEITT